MLMNRRKGVLFSTASETGPKPTCQPAEGRSAACLSKQPALWAAWMSQSHDAHQGPRGSHSSVHLGQKSWVSWAEWSGSQC